MSEDKLQELIKTIDSLQDDKIYALYDIIIHLVTKISTLEKEIEKLKEEIISLEEDNRDLFDNLLNLIKED